MSRSTVFCAFNLQQPDWIDTFYAPMNFLRDTLINSFLSCRDRVFKLNLKNISLAGCEVSFELNSFAYQWSNLIKIHISFMVENYWSPLTIPRIPKNKIYSKACAGFLYHFMGFRSISLESIKYVKDMFLVKWLCFDGNITFGINK